MQLRLSDPSYADRLACFLTSLGQAVLVVAPDELEVDAPTSSVVAEIVIYLGVWSVLYPDAEVVQIDDGGEISPA